MTLKVQYIKPNLLQNRNLVASVNLVWVTDFPFLRTKITGEPKSKTKLLLVYDLGNGEIVGAKVFKFNKTKVKNNQEKYGISSLYVTKFFKSLLIKYNIIHSDNPLIIHSDRGTEFVSKEYCQLEQQFAVKLSMTKGYQPIDNAVAERLNNTFKNQLNNIDPTIPKTVKTIKQLQSVVNQRVKNFNKTFKSKRNEHLGADLYRQLSESSTEPLPVPSITHSQGILQKKPDQALDVENYNIQVFRQNVAKTYVFDDDQANFSVQQIQLLLEKLHDKQEKLNVQQHLGALYQIKFNQNTQEKLDQILAYLKPKVNKNFVQKQPQRLPLTKELYYHIMEEPRRSKQQVVGYYRFRLVSTILYFTGMRLQEVGNLTEQDVEQLIETKTVQILMTKTNRYRVIAIPEQGQQFLEQIKQQIKFVFDFSEIKTQHRTIRHTTNTKNNYNNFIAWYNRLLKMYLIRVAVRLNDPILFQNIKLLSSHSYRINKVTQWLWKHIPLPEVSKMIGHQNRQTTNLYYRWSEFNNEMLNKITEMEE